MHSVSRTNAHHDITELVNHGKVKNTKTWISWVGNAPLLQNKNILNLRLRWHILRSYCFGIEVTFKSIFTNFTGVSFSSNETTLSWKVFWCFWGRGVLRQNEKLCVYSMTWMNKLDLSKKAAFKSSSANLV